MNHRTSSGVVLLIIVAVAAPQAVAQEGALRGQWVAVDGEMYGAAVPEASLPLVRLTFDETEARWTIPGYPQRFRYTVYGDGAPDSLDFHLPVDEPRAWRIPVRSRLRGDTLFVAVPLTGPFDPAQDAPPGRPGSVGLSEPGEFLRLSLVRRPVAPTPTAALTGEEAKAADAIDADAIEQMTRTLVTPEMEGRGSGQPGGERAARAIADWFREAGLEPLGDDGFLQSVPLFLGRAAPTSSLTIGDTTFHIGTDFSIASVPMRTRPAMNLDVEGEVFLFGPSLGARRAVAPLPNLDVEGKIVAWVVPTGPGDGSGSDVMRTYQALHQSGAEAIIALFPGPLPEPLLHTPLFGTVSTLDANLYNAGPAPPLVLLGPQAFGTLFGDGADVFVFMDSLASGEPIVQPTGKRVALSYEIEETTAAPTYNVAGVIRGTDPALRDEAVVYTAHYDAFGRHDGVVYIGAADNALGVAEMTEIADAMQESGVRPRCSIVFLAVGAEERGMLGTLHWTRHPTWPLDRVVANINMDGGDAEAWGPLHGVIDLTRQATLSDVAAEVGATMGLPLLPNDGPGGLGSSDFYDFLRAGIPAIQLMGIGGDPALSPMRSQQWNRQRVHRPGDVIDEGWDWTGPSEMAQLYLLLGLRVANADETPSIRETSPFATAGEDSGR